MKKIFLLILLAFTAILLGALPAQAQTPTFTPTFTSTISPTGTPTFTSTSTPTFTPTITVTCGYRYFGNFTGTSQAPVTSEMAATKYTNTQGGVAWYMRVDVAVGGQVQVGIYSDAGGVPGNLLVQSGVSNVAPGVNYFNDVSGVNLPVGDYWLCVSTYGAAQLTYVTGSAGSEYVAPFGGGSLPALFPAGSFGNRNWSIVMSETFCSNTPVPSYTPTPTGSPTHTPTITPTPPITATYTPTVSPTPSGPTTFVYVNPEGACSAAFGCTVTCVHTCRLLNLDITTCYIIMRLCGLAGCQPADVMALRLTMGWDEICGYYGIDWTAFTADLQTRMNTLQREIITPNQILRGAANDPDTFPIQNPGNVPDILNNGNTHTEANATCS